MTGIDWDSIKPKKRAPTRAELSLYLRWRKYLRDSRLSEREQHERAAMNAENGNEVPRG